MDLSADAAGRPFACTASDRSSRRLARRSRLVARASRCAARWVWAWAGHTSEAGSRLLRVALAGKAADQHNEAAAGAVFGFTAAEASDRGLVPGQTGPPSGQQPCARTGDNTAAAPTTWSCTHGAGVRCRRQACGKDAGKEGRNRARGLQAALAAPLRNQGRHMRGRWSEQAGASNAAAAAECTAGSRWLVAPLSRGSYSGGQPNRSTAMALERPVPPVRAHAATPRTQPAPANGGMSGPSPQQPSAAATRGPAAARSARMWWYPAPASSQPRAGRR